MTKQLQRHFAASFFSSNRFSSRLAFTVQLSLQSLYPASVTYHPLKEKKKKKRKADKNQAISEKRHPRTKWLLEGYCSPPCSDLKAEQLARQAGRALPAVLGEEVGCYFGVLRPGAGAEQAALSSVGGSGGGLQVPPVGRGC